MLGWKADNGCPDDSIRFLTQFEIRYKSP